MNLPDLPYLTLLVISLCIFYILLFVLVVLKSLTPFVLSCFCHLPLLALPSHLHSQLEHTSRTKDVLQYRTQEDVADRCKSLQIFAACCIIFIFIHLQLSYDLADWYRWDTHYSNLQAKREVERKREKEMPKLAGLVQWKGRVPVEIGVHSRICSRGNARSCGSFDDWRNSA